MSGIDALRRKKARAPVGAQASPAAARPVEARPSAPNYVVGGGQVRRREVLRKPLARLHPDPGQPRRLFDESELAELARSLELDGLQQPILVRPHDEAALRANDHFIIVAGERRYRAAKLNGYVDIEVMVYDGSDPGRAALIENLLRSDLTAMEQAGGIERLARRPDGGAYSLSELASMLPLSRSRIGHLLQIATLPARIQESLLTGARHATSKALLVVAREKDPDAQWELFLRLSARAGDEPTPEVPTPDAPTASRIARERAPAVRDGADLRRSGELVRRLNRKITHLLGSDLPPDAVSTDDLAHYRILHERLGRFLATLTPPSPPSGP